jgi:predicted nucleic acid-binding protein
LQKSYPTPALPAGLISSQYLIEELTKHQDKIVRFAKRPEPAVLELQYSYLRNIALYDETLISEANWIKAEALTDGVDHFDVSYVALTLQTGSFLWTGDKKLSAHLRKMGFDRVFNTAELSALLNIR